MIIFGLIIILIGVIFLYDIRELTKKVFSYSDRKNATLLLRVVGLMLNLIGSLIIMFNI